MQKTRTSEMLMAAIERLSKEFPVFPMMSLARRVLITVPVCLAMTAASAAAQQQVVPPEPIVVDTPVVTINNSPGNQSLPHVSGDLAAYTDGDGGTIRYYRFSTGSDTPVPLGTAAGPETLSDVNSSRICFSRQEAAAFEIVVFDTTTSSTAEIDPGSGHVRLGCALGGDTLAYVDFGTGQGLGDIYFYDLGANPAAPPQPISLDPNQEGNPNVSPAGNIVVWENCPFPANCDIFKGVKSGSVWSVSSVAQSAFGEQNPDTDGTLIVYDSNQGTATGQDIYFLPAVGGPTTQLVLPGVQVNPSISKGFIAFEGYGEGSFHPDIFVYDSSDNALYQITSTSDIDENLNDVSVLDNGDVRIVWNADDGFAHEQNVYGTTFTPIHRKISYSICPLYDANVAKKSGSAFPIKIQLCDSSGHNLSSSTVVVHAAGITRVSSNTPAALDDTGNANPDFDFRYDASLAGYVFNLNTKGYAPGTYSLSFTAGLDPATHAVSFAVK